MCDMIDIMFSVVKINSNKVIDVKKIKMICTFLIIISNNNAYNILI